jgi:hypothetical protein
MPFMVENPCIPRENRYRERETRLELATSSLEG